MLDILLRAGSFVTIILLGFLLRRIGFFQREDFSLLSKITIRVTLPCVIITSFSGKVIDPALLSLSVLALGCGLLYVF
jgi:predicted permease